jgi:hypothetical protein
MKAEHLREKIARSIAEVHGAVGTTREPLYTDDADAVLAALGLDDLDAAVERATGWLHESPYSQCNMGSDTCDTRPLARGVLEAALAPNQSQSGDSRAPNGQPVCAPRLRPPTGWAGVRTGASSGDEVASRARRMVRARRC